MYVSEGINTDEEAGTRLKAGVTEKARDVDPA